MKKFLNITLYELAMQENMSARAIGVCTHMGLDTLEKIQYYYMKQGGFMHLRNVGSKTNAELIDLCKKLEIDENSVKDHSLIPGIGNPRIKIKHDLELRVLANIERMSPVCIHHCLHKELTSLNLIMRYFNRYQKNGYLLSKSCGTRVAYELEKICRKYEFDYENNFDYANSEKKLSKGWDDSEYSPLKQFLKQLNIDRLIYERIIQEVNGLEEVPLFFILDKLIDGNMVFETELKTSVFKRTLNCYLNTPETTLTGIRKQFGRSLEGVRIIRKKMVNKLRYYLPVNTLHGFLEIFNHYIHDQDKPVILISNEDAKKINDKEGTNFSPLFIAYILSYLYSDKYRRLGITYHLFLDKVNKDEKRVKHFYLIDRDLTRHFDFEEFFNFLETLLQERRSSAITYDSIIQNFQKFQFEDKQAVINVITYIVLLEFSDDIRFGNEELIFCGEGM